MMTEYEIELEKRIDQVKNKKFPYAVTIKFKDSKYWPILNWCIVNTGINPGLWDHYISYDDNFVPWHTFAFKNETDAVAFNLTWS